jgi:hypothetical protein
MALSKIQASSINLADNFTFTGNISGTSDVKLIEAKTLNNQQYVEFTSGIGSDYDMYMWHLSNVDVDTDSNIQIQYSIDGGSTYKSGATEYSYAVRGYRDNNEFGTNVTENDSHINLTFSGAIVDDNDAHNASGVLYMTSHTNSSTRCHFWSHMGWVSGNSGHVTGSYGSGSIKTVSHNPNAIRFKLSSGGNYTSGKIKMYGWK